MHAPEILYAVGAALLLGALIWGTFQYNRRNSANEPITDKATRDLYQRPEQYEREKPELEKQLR